MKQLKIILILVSLIILINQVVGFGVTDWLNGPISVAPGDSKEVVFELQNMLGNEDLIAKAEIKSGSDIASIKEGTEIEVPFGVKKEIHILINIPETYTEGNYPVIINFVTAPTKKSVDQPIQFGVGVEKNININVNSAAPQSEVPVQQEETKKETFSNIGIVALLVMLAILIIIVIIVKFIHKNN